MQEVHARPEIWRIHERTLRPCPERSIVTGDGTGDGQFNARRCVISRCFGLLLTVVLATSAEEAAGQGNTPQMPRQIAPSFFVRLEVNHQTASYREGDNLSVTAVSEIDCYAYVAYHQADGKTFLIFPNPVQKDNRLKARQPVSIPAKDDLFRWQVSAPFGKEKIAIICTKEPLAELSAEELGSTRFNRLTPQQLKGVELEIGQQKPSAWGIDEIELTTYARGAEARDPNQKRIGVFFGVAQYQFNVEAEAANKGLGLNLATCHRDARQLADVLKEVGELSEVRVFTNEQATRDNLELTVTQWLPKVTRPGDTVFIYFSGHGSQIPDDNGDEKDGIDELLIPHDYVSLGILNEAVKRAKEGQLDPQNAERTAQALEIVKKAGSIEAGEQALARKTGISDDLFGHLLQRLSGRQIIVVLDICFAGGFATEEKDLVAAPNVKAFDFADGEVGRLKDLGQKDLALLAASSAGTTSGVRTEKDLSVMTFFLLDAINAAPARLTIEQAFEHCKTEMRVYFERQSREAQAAGKPPEGGHVPQLWNYSTRPVFLKP